MTRVPIAVVVFVSMLAGVVSAQDAAPAGEEQAGFSQDQLDQVVAPIALYPDPLVAQVLMAATYPLEIVEADRWVQANPGVSGPAVDDAIKDKRWDPSVKSLVKVPEVLTRMSGNLEWTRDLGDAFLGQQAEVLDAVQRMRAKAMESGNLATTQEQTVTTEGEDIVIEPADPEMVYVPTYSTEVYGSGWTYAQSYYPWMYQPGRGVLRFAAGVLVGGALWGDCDWGGNDVDIDVNKFNNFNRVTNDDFREMKGNKQSWKHDAAHRQGVGYKDKAVAQKYGGTTEVNRAANNKARGRDAGAGANRGGGAGGVAGAGANRPSPSPRPQPAQHGSGFSGAQRPSQDRAASNRGSQSRQPSGGGSRGGGGGGGGGRGGGGRGGGRR